VALRRSHHDAKARRNLLYLSGYLLFIFGWIGFNLFRAYRHDLFNVGRMIAAVLIFMAVSAALILGGRALYSRYERRKMERTSPAVSADLKRHLYRETCLLATLLERSASESALAKGVPSDVEIITRRVLLDRLNTLGLRDELEPWLLDLLLAPDGHWTDEQKQRAAPSWESLAVLRWALGLSELRELTMDPRYTMADVRSLFTITEPENLLALPSWDQRPARNQAGSFFKRCWSELLARRVVTGAAEEDVEEALMWRAEIQEEGYTGDYLVGSRTITELETPILLKVMSRAYSRWQLLSLLVAITGGEVPPDQLRSFLARYFAPAEVLENQGASESA
jgi:hypothetical protein